MSKRLSLVFSLLALSLSPACSDDATNPAADGDVLIEDTRIEGDSRASDTPQDAADATPQDTSVLADDTPQEAVDSRDDELGSDLAADSAPLDVTDLDDLADEPTEDLGIDALDATTDTSPDLPPPLECEEGRIHMVDGRLHRDGGLWRMLGVNYIVDIRHDEADGFYIGPHHAYCDDNRCCMTADDCLVALQADLATIADMGMNAIRLVGMAGRLEEGSFRVPTTENILPTTLSPGRFLEVIGDGGEMGTGQAQVLSLLGAAVTEAESAGLVVLHLAGRRALDEPATRALYAGYLGDLAAHFADEPTYFGIDLWNEPAYEAAEPTPDKAAAAGWVRSWYDAIRASAPLLLVTMGLTDAGTVRGWDPGVLPLDFVTYHPYPGGAYEGARQANYEANLAFFRRIELPWAIGETGFAVEDWGDADMQATFANESLALARDCGGMGHNWWTYQDTHWGGLDHFGLLDWGEAERAATDAFDGFDWEAEGGSCPAPPHPFNPYDYPDTYAVSGRVIDSEGAPVGNAVVVGWRCPDWSGANYRTYTDNNGRFELRADTGIVSVSLSAPGLSLANYFPDCVAKDYGTIVLSTVPVTPVVPPVCE